MASERQREANRRNALKSTGPRTDAGKAASRTNAVTHGLLSNVVLIADDPEQETLGLLREQMNEDLAPVGALEEFLVDRIVSAMWRLRRALRVESAAFQGFAERFKGSPQERAQALLDNVRIPLVQRYEKEIERQFYRALTELQKLQAARRKAEREDTEAGAADPPEADAAPASAAVTTEQAAPSKTAAAPTPADNRPATDARGPSP